MRQRLLFPMLALALTCAPAMAQDPVPVLVQFDENNEPVRPGAQADDAATSETAASELDLGYGFDFTQPDEGQQAAAEDIAQSERRQRYGRLSQSIDAERARREAACRVDSDLIATGTTGPRVDADGNMIPASRAGCEQPAAATRPVQARRETVVERQSNCEETENGYSCSSSITIGNSEEGRNAAREALDELLRD